MVVVNVLSRTALVDYFRQASDISRSLDFAKQYSDSYHDMIKKVGSEIEIPRGACLCSFGSPSRYEMIGESDLDCFIVHDETTDINQFRKVFHAKLENVGYDKLDIPVWGSLKECKTYLQHSITEGNQVLEARFIAGDAQVWSSLLELKEKYLTLERALATFCFQYHYFEQYYRQRERVANLKYGHGGTRDFLFPVWFNQIFSGITEIHIDKPAIINGIERMWAKGLIDRSSGYLQAASDIAFLRNELLFQSRKTQDSGLTYLNLETAAKIAHAWPWLFEDGDAVLTRGQDARKKVWKLKEICYAAFTQLPVVIERMNEGYSGELYSIEEVWKVNISQLSDSDLIRLVKSDSWAIQTSLACNPTCPPNVLDQLFEKGIVPGYEYILKVVGRNKYTSKSTLLRIAESNAEIRFREPAIVRLEKGWHKANEL